jgi:hypothetical protein
VVLNISVLATQISKAAALDVIHPANPQKGD